LHELRQKIQRYERFLTYFSEWGYKYDYQLKILILGLSDEQSEILSEILNKKDVQAGKNVIGINFYTKLIENFDKSFTNLQIWEISSNDRFETIRTQYYKGATAVIIVFEKSNRESFDRIKEYHTELKDATELIYKGKLKKKKEIRIPIAIIGLGKDSVIPIEEIYSTAKNLGAQFFDVERIRDSSFQEALNYAALQVLVRFQE
jgi:hypothetical protein